MFGPRFKEQKLKVNLGLVVTRLKLVEKKKTDQALRARPEIADYVRNAKIDRARVRVEAIIREDYLVEAMELVEMYADLLAGRVGLMKQSKALDEGLKTPVSTLIWAAPRLQQYCQELKVVHDLLVAYYGKKYVKEFQNNDIGTVCDRVMQKLDVKPPKKILVEKYLIEICKAADVEFTPDRRIMAEELETTANLIDTDFNSDFMQFNQNTPGGPGFPPGGPGFPPGGMPPPSGPGGMGGGGGGSSIPMVPAFSYTPVPQPTASTYNIDPNQGPSISNNLPPYSATDPNVYEGIPEENQAPFLPSKGPAGFPEKKVDLSKDPSGVSPSLPPYVAAPRSANSSTSTGLPNLPSVPTTFPETNQSMDNQSSTTNDVDFDDLSRRLENLRKKT